MHRLSWTRVFGALIAAVITLSEPALSIESVFRLRNGLPGSVPCQLGWKPDVVVSWAKGATIDTATTLVILETIQSGSVSGPGFDNGRFTVAANYSLIINKVNSGDSGRYFCVVLDYISGSSHSSPSDVTVFDPLVITDDWRVLQFGERAILSCRYEEAVSGVHWMKGENYNDAKRLVSLDLNSEISQQRECEQGVCHLTDDFSLVFNSTKIRDEGRYFCAVSDMATGRLLINSTDVNVVAAPQEPYPDIDTCEPISTYESVQTCEISEDINTTVSLTCTVKRHYPTISLSFSDTSNTASTVQVSISTDTEGLLTQVVTIVLLVGTDPVTCTASGLPFETTRTTQGVFTPTTTAGIQTDRNDVIALPAHGNGGSEYIGEFGTQ